MFLRYEGKKSNHELNLHEFLGYEPNYSAIDPSTPVHTPK